MATLDNAGIIREMYVRGMTRTWIGTHPLRRQTRG